MTRFTVPEMSCGHCTSAIEKAIRAIDPQASVTCKLEDHSVAITSDLPVEKLQAALFEAGYPSHTA